MATISFLAAVPGRAPRQIVSDVDQFVADSFEPPFSMDSTPESRASQETQLTGQALGRLVSLLADRGILGLEDILHVTDGGGTQFAREATLQAA